MRASARGSARHRACSVAKSSRGLWRVPVFRRKGVSRRVESKMNGAALERRDPGPKTIGFRTPSELDDIFMCSPNARDPRHAEAGDHRVLRGRLLASLGSTVFFAIEPDYRFMLAVREDEEAFRVTE